ncbi:MAG: carbamoyl transferase [PVC group bacterium]|nr:carbamoyl transferase [PVC group bacterium]
MDVVVLASHMTPSFILRNFRNAHAKLRNKNSQFSFLLSLYTLYQTIARKSIFLEKIERYWSCRYLKRRLKGMGIDSKVVIIEHHMAHAYGAYSTSGFEQALVITIDGLGDSLSFTVSLGKAGKITRIFAQNAFNDITLYYSRLTETLGFTPIQDEGKVMGLAGYTDEYSCLSEAQKLLQIKEGRFRTNNFFFSANRDKRLYERLKKRPREEVAASFQAYLEGEIEKLVRCWIKKTNMHNICLSGGFFANIKVSQKIAAMEEVDDIYVYPHMGDGGLALGAVFAYMQPKPFKLENIFFGPSYSNEYIRKILQKHNVEYEFVEDIEKRVGEILSEGKIVARFCGKMEYGPRALGNRSILCSAIIPKICKELNKKLGRDMFMPFAPAILHEYRDECCVGVRKAEYSAQFMNISFACTQYFKNTCPAVVHKDGTTRPQFVLKHNNNGFYRIIDEYRKITGVPAVINTSFNVHEEPIVCTPQEALYAFRKAKLNFLAISNFLIKGVKYV